MLGALVCSSVFYWLCLRWNSICSEGESPLAAPKGLVRKGGNSEGIRMLDKPETISFSSLLKCVSLTLLQLTFICSFTLIYGNKK